ncbi:hypothetical protein NW762_011725 [Fusarium torreyae]|uniref:Uncharacterized protein n=1 Tax=Fusarium torreyae TaxID=1237075 RepID=A0A9W8RQQ9_9HYPO|nr:hypothetical protein NW762_011725 [Fusarium torreyae]
MSLSDTKAPEQLFLDLSVQEILDKSDGLPVIEPWATSYVSAVRDGRFGDAIWARYHIMGEVTNNGTIEGLTVLESIEQDAVGYKKYSPDQFSEAVSFYANAETSADGHANVIEIILRINEEDVSGRHVPEGG